MKIIPVVAMLLISGLSCAQEATNVMQGTVWTMRYKMNGGEVVQEDKLCVSQLDRGVLNMFDPVNLLMLNPILRNENNHCSRQEKTDFKGPVTDYKFEYECSLSHNLDEVFKSIAHVNIKALITARTNVELGVATGDILMTGYQLETGKKKARPIFDSNGSIPLSGKDKLKAEFVMIQHKPVQACVVEYEVLDTMDAHSFKLIP